MNTPISKFLRLLPLLFLSEYAQAGINLSINSIAQSNQSVNLSIVISGLDSGAAPSLSSYDFDVSFDPNKLSFASASFGDSTLGNQLDLYGFGSNPTTAQVTQPGILNLSELSFDSITDLHDQQASSFTLATVSFNFIEYGNSDVNFTVNSLGDAEGNALYANNPLISIPVVPEQPVFLMMLTGLIGLMFKGKRQELM